MDSPTIRLRDDQLTYIMRKTGEWSPGDAIELMLTIMTEELVPPTLMPLYIDIMMTKEGLM